MSRARCLLLVSVVVVVPPASAGKAASGPKPEELARAVALDFARAFNVRSVDQMMKVSAIPFLPGRQIVGPTSFGPEKLLLRIEKELRAKLAEKVRGTLPEMSQRWSTMRHTASNCWSVPMRPKRWRKPSGKAG